MPEMLSRTRFILLAESTGAITSDPALHWSQQKAHANSAAISSHIIPEMRLILQKICMKMHG